MPLVWFFMAFLTITNSFFTESLSVWLHYSCRSLTSMAVSIPGEFSGSLALLNSSLFSNKNIFPDTTQAYVWLMGFLISSISLPSFPHQVTCQTISKWPKPDEFAFWTVEFHPTAASPKLVVTLISLCDISTCHPCMIKCLLICTTL